MIKPDIVLSDVMMPSEIDSLGLSRQIKASTNGCYVVFFSAKGKKHDIELGLQAGADLYKVKPLNSINFKTQIRRGLWLLH